MQFTLQRYSCEWQIQLGSCRELVIPSLSLAAVGVSYSLFWAKCYMPCVVWSFIFVLFLKKNRKIVFIFSHLSKSCVSLWSKSHFSS